MEYRSDFLVLGSGIAGLSAALKLAEIGTVNIVTKKKAVNSNTNHAQGGIATVTDKTDSFDSHVADTLKAGAYLGNEEIVRLIVEEGPARIRDLIDIGVRFSGEDQPDLGLEGGHSHRRILHAADLTGREIEGALLAACRTADRIRFFEDHTAVDLPLAEHPSKVAPASNRCLGAYVLENAAGVVHTFSAAATVLATGGAGKVYLYTSNPDIASGDGLAMAYRAGAELRNLEFVQFHPTCLYNPGSTKEEGRRFLLSEALRGEGGLLLDHEGNRFMETYDSRKELASRDIVARAIDAEMKRTGAKCVFLDVSHKGKAFLKERFPNIYEHCLGIGLDIAREPIPVVPAAHFFRGGIHVDADGASAVGGLFAVGEVCHTGLHGANRLASNSLLEGTVLGHRVYIRLKREAGEFLKRKPPVIPCWDPGKAVRSEEADVVRYYWHLIRETMWTYVGIVRNDRRLNLAQGHLENFSAAVSDYYWKYLINRDLIELRNISLLAELIVRSARSRKESRGLHYNEDHPQPLESERRDSVLSRYHGGRTTLGSQEAAPV